MALKDPDSDVRLRAAEALWKITRDSERVLPVLIERLKSSEEDIRAQAAELLGLSRTTAYAHWAYARAWLHQEIQGGASPNDHS